MSEKELYPFQSKKFELAGGQKLAYIDEGDQSGDKPCLLMVHGNPTWSFYYRNLVKDFSNSFRCIALDHIGCGYSDKPQDYNYTLAQHVDNLCALVEHLKLKNVVMVIHDWGGAIGMGYATRYPESIKALLILNTAAFFSSRIPFRIQMCRIPLIGTLINRGLNGFALAAVTMATAKGKSLPVEVAKKLVSPYDTWSNRVAIDAFVKDIPTNENDPAFAPIKEIEEKLSVFKDTPKMMLWGGQDFCFNDSFYEKWLQIFPNIDAHKYEDGGHYVLEDCYADIKTRLEKFLAQLPD